MKVTGYLYVTKHGNLRLLKMDHAPNASEVKVRIDLDLPDQLFARPVPVVKIKIPTEAVIDPTVESVVEITAKTVADALRVDRVDVTDGLERAIAKSRGESETEAMV